MEIKENLQNEEIKKLNQNKNENFINTNKLNENSFISLNKDKLYETFYLFQKFLTSSQNDGINSINENNRKNQQLQEFMKQQNFDNHIYKTEPDKNNINIYQTEEIEEKFDIINSQNFMEKNNNIIYVRKNINEPICSGGGCQLNIDNNNNYYYNNCENNYLKKNTNNRNKNGIILNNVNNKKKQILTIRDTKLINQFNPLKPNLEKSRSFYVKNKNIKNSNNKNYISSPIKSPYVRYKRNHATSNKLSKININSEKKYLINEEKLKDKKYKQPLSKNKTKKPNKNFCKNYFFHSMEKLMPLNIKSALNTNKNDENNLNINLNIKQKINNINYNTDPNSKGMIHLKSSKNNKNDSLPGTIQKKLTTEIKVKKKISTPVKIQIIQEKIKELDEETLKFREERKKVTEIKNEYQKLSQKLLKDIEEFNSKKEKFEKNKNIMNNPLLFSENKIISNLKNQNQTLITVNKKDKETIKTLKNQISSLQNIIKQKDEEIKIFKNIINNQNRELIKKEDFEDNEEDNNYKTCIDFNKNRKKLQQEKLTNASVSKNKKTKKNSYIRRKNKNNQNLNKNIFNNLINQNKKNNLPNNLNLNSTSNSKTFNASSTQRKQLKFSHMKLDTNSSISNFTEVSNDNNKNNNKCSKTLRKSFTTNTNTLHKNDINTLNFELNKNDSKPLSPLRNNNNLKTIDLHEKLYEKEIKNNINDNYDFIIPDKYVEQNNNLKLIQNMESEGKNIKIYSNNKKEISFKSGVKKEIFSDGYQLVHFPNGDMKQNFPEEGKVIYFFNETKTVQTSFKNGLNIFKFSNNQIEKHYPNGSKFIIFPDGTKKYIEKNYEKELDDSFITVKRNIDKNDNNDYFYENENRANGKFFIPYIDFEQNIKSDKKVNEKIM